MKLRRRTKWLLAPLALVAANFLGVALFWLAEPRIDVPREPRISGADWPPGFLWGTATSAHQVEGGDLVSDWTRFESQAGRVRERARSGEAAGHWDRVAEDIGWMEKLGANAYRFSISWARLEPRDGVWDEAAWTHYQEETRALVAAGITPMVTLLHFAQPEWLAERGGLESPEFPARFARFAGEAARRLGGEVDLWCTINEPFIHMYLGFVKGWKAPGLRDPERAARAWGGLLRAHAAATAALRAADPGARVGITEYLAFVGPESRWRLWDWISARLARRAINGSFADAVLAGRSRLRLPGFPWTDVRVPELQGTLDWFGVNYYTRFLLGVTPSEPNGVEILQSVGEQMSDTRLEIFPSGLLPLLRETYEKLGVPIYITENGLASADGRNRASFLRRHAWVMRQAIAEQIPLRGYFYWTLLDDFEWADGYEAKFGLLRVDRATLARSLAPGAEEFERLSPRRR